MSKVGQSSPVAADLEIVPTTMRCGLWAWIRLEAPVRPGINRRIARGPQGTAHWHWHWIRAQELSSPVQSVLVCLAIHPSAISGRAGRAG